MKKLDEFFVDCISCGSKKMVPFSVAVEGCPVCGSDKVEIYSTNNNEEENIEDNTNNL